MPRKLKSPARKRPVTAPRLIDHRPFALFWLARLAGTIGHHMLTVAIGWKLYELTGSALDLGYVGLLQFIPAVVLTLLIGHLADRYDRRLIVRCAQAITIIAAGLLLFGFVFGASREILFTATFLIGCARAFELPSAHALVPSLVPQALVPRAIAAWTSANQAAVISGPALGGLLYAVSPLLVAALSAAFLALAFVLVTLVKVRRVPPPREAPTFASVFAGFEYVRNRPRLLGVITLDLFVVLLGGATALLPVFARDILQTGPVGLGILRSAPAIGALAMSLYLARHPVERRIGIKMFWCVAIFGLATSLFAVSTWFPLSVVALAVLGGADSMSVVIRFALVQIETPDDKRGRVGAINYLFVGTSNTLGEFESGAVAAWLGPVTSVLIGGVGSLLIAGIWMAWFPSLRRIDRFKPAR